MAKLFIQDTTLTAIADAIRSKTGGTIVEYYDSMDIQLTKTSYGAIDYEYCSYTFPGASSIKVQIVGNWTTPSSGAGYVTLTEGIITSNGSSSTKIQPNKTYTFSGDSVTVYFRGEIKSISGYIQIKGYDANGELIQFAVESEGDNTTQYKPTEMPAAILSISGEGGGGIIPTGELEITENGSYDVTTYASAQVSVPTGVFPEGTLEITENGEHTVTTYEKVNVNVASSGGDIGMEDVVLTGPQAYGCAGALSAKTIELFPDKISTSGITVANHMFYNSTLEEIPFDINFSGASYYSAANFFQGAKNLKSVPAMNNLNSDNLQSLLAGCESVREIPEGWADTWNLDRFHTYAYSYGQAMFQQCRSLRSIPTSVLKHLYNPATGSYSNCYGSMFESCHNLDEIRGLAISPATLTSNVFSGTFSRLNCLRALVFETNEDGSAKTANWKSQTIDLSSSIGYNKLDYNFTPRDSLVYNSGRTLEKCIYDDATYAALKDDSDAWVSGYASENPIYYSLYNHDSAVETINSLPDCSASGGTNTIKFQGEAGLKTDGGAINTLTEAEIAVATAKGWTVSIT